MDKKVIMQRVVELSRRGMTGGFGGCPGSFASSSRRWRDSRGRPQWKCCRSNDPTAHAEMLAIACERQN